MTEKGLYPLKQQPTSTEFWDWTLDHQIKVENKSYTLVQC